MYQGFIKPLFDFIGALTILIVTSPLFITTWILLLMVNKGKAFFVQERPGKGEKIFKVVKFKTMNDLIDKDGQLLSDELRLTKTGKWIRRFSLDELPQLINVLKAEMSIVGPRPLLVGYLPLYNEFQKKRHSVKPGITGWAQINGRNEVSWQERFKMDVWYVNNVSFILDLKIMILSIIKIFKAEGISSTNSATMENFTGNRNL